MSKLQFVSNCGIGDLIHTRQLLDGPLKFGHSINVVLGTSNIQNFWAGDRLTFLIWLTNKLFSNKNYSVYFSANEIGRPPQVLLGNKLVEARIPDLRIEFECKDLYQENYLVILTKVRGINKHQIIELLQHVSGKLKDIAQTTPILLLGERDVEYGAEYQMHGNSFVYSIYRELTQIIPTFIDKTIPALGITPPTAEQFLTDCKIMSKARAVLCFGSGGNVSIAMSVSRVINYWQEYEMGDLFKHFEGHDTKCVTKNFEKFLMYLEST